MRNSKLKYNINKTVTKRNEAICSDYASGMTVAELAKKYHLKSVYIKNIVPQTKRKRKTPDIPTRKWIDSHASNTNEPTPTTYMLVRNYYTNDTETPRNPHHRILTHEEALREIADTLKRTVAEVANILNKCMEG